MAKLIVLNGPLGIGKTTLAKKYADNYPLTLSLDIDELRTWISHWRDYADASAYLSKNMAMEMARTSLQAGHDVVISQICRKPELLENLEEVSVASNSRFYEILLWDTKENATRRFIERGERSGKPGGFNPDGLIGRNGGISHVEKMYEEMMMTAKQRPKTITINSIENNPEATYKELVKQIGL